MENTKKIIYLIVALVLVVGLVWFVKSKKTPPVSQKQDQKQQTKASMPEIKQVEKTRLPENFPSNIPVEQGATIEQNFNAEQNGYVQATRKFVSTKTVQENFDLYKKWLAENGWKMEAELNQDNIKALGASNGNGKLTISINKNSVTNQVTVDLSYTVKK